MGRRRGNWTTRFSLVACELTMNIQTILLLAALLCAESPAGTYLERFLMAETVAYRSRVSGMSIEEVIYAPHQYAGVHTIDLEGYKLYRPEELAENINIAVLALMLPPIRVSNFARTGSCWYDKPCEWESRCEKIVEEGRHTFYLCP